jgi:hypothetical protein
MHTLLGNRLNTRAGAPTTPPPRLPATWPEVRVVTT